MHTTIHTQEYSEWHCYSQQKHQRNTTDHPQGNANGPGHVGQMKTNIPSKMGDLNIILNQLEYWVEQKQAEEKDF